MFKLALIVTLGLGVYYRFPALEDRLLFVAGFALVYLLIKELVREQLSSRA